MVISRHVHTVVERTAGNSLTQNLLEGRIVRCRQALDEIERVIERLTR